MTRPVDTEARAKIAELHKKGWSGLAIARDLDISPSMVRLHLRALGVKAKKQLRALPVRSGKRRCIVCRKVKPLSSFPSDRDSTCRNCFKRRAKEAE